MSAVPVSVDQPTSVVTLLPSVVTGIMPLQVPCGVEIVSSVVLLSLTTTTSVNGPVSKPVEAVVPLVSVPVAPQLSAAALPSGPFVATPVPVGGAPVRTDVVRGAGVFFPVPVYVEPALRGFNPPTDGPVPSFVSARANLLADIGGVPVC